MTRMLKTADPTIVPVPTSDLAIKTPEIKVHKTVKVLTFQKCREKKMKLKRDLQNLQLESIIAQLTDKRRKKFWS